jgi:hypothetical protein
MINSNSLVKVGASGFSKHFRKPLYDSYCFSNIPGTIEKLLCGDTTLQTLPDDTPGNSEKSYDKVVLFFVDAFGWCFFDKYKDRYPFLQQVINQGVASKLTSQFPSTTAAHVTTIHTGQRVDDSGVFEWFYYEPKVDAMIAPLLFSYAADKERDTLKSSGVEPREIYPTSSLYQRLAKRGVRSYLYQSKEYTPSSYGEVVTAGVDSVLPFSTLSEAFTELRRDVTEENGKGYFYIYFSPIDSIGHQYGPSSPQFEAEVDTFFTALERLFWEPVTGKCGNTLLLMTADHGQVDIDPQTTVYINREIFEVTSWMKTNKKGEPLIIGGSCRDLFFYVKDKHITEAQEKLAWLLKGKAEVYRVDDLLEQGFFGDKPSELLKSRIGNLCILPYDHESIYWWEQGKFEQNFYGHHGGLTPAEMETILLALPL